MRRTVSATVVCAVTTDLLPEVPSAGVRVWPVPAPVATAARP